MVDWKAPKSNPGAPPASFAVPPPSLAVAPAGGDFDGAGPPDAEGSGAAGWEVSELEEPVLQLASAAIVPPVASHSAGDVSTRRTGVERGFAPRRWARLSMTTPFATPVPRDAHRLSPAPIGDSAGRLAPRPVSRIEADAFAVTPDPYGEIARSADRSGWKKNVGEQIDICIADAGSRRCARPRVTRDQGYAQKLPPPAPSAGMAGAAVAPSIESKYATTSSIFFCTTAGSVSVRKFGASAL